VLLGTGETSLLKKAEEQRFSAFLRGRASAKSATEEDRIPKLFLLVLICSIFQFYIFPPVMGIYVPFYLVAVYALAFKVNWLEAGKTVIGMLLISLYLMQIISWFWSPDVVLGVRDLIYTFPFLIVYLYLYQCFQVNPVGILKAVRIFCVIAVAQSLLVIIFWKSPELQTLFRSHAFGKLFLNPNWIVSFELERKMKEGIVAAGEIKSSGFFMNGNVAGAWGASILYITIAAFSFKSEHKKYAERQKQTINTNINWLSNNRILKLKKTSNKELIFNFGHKVLAPLHMLGIFFCGSKASLGLIFLSPLLSIFYLFPSSRRALVFIVALVIIVLIILIPFYEAIASLLFSSDYIENSIRTFLSRLFLWEHAWHEFFTHPVFGHGYGGWQISMQGLEQKAFGLDIDVKDSFPPHNSFIYLWSQSGLLALAIGVAVVVVSIKTFGKLKEVNPIMGFCFLTAYLFFIIQACAENYPILGEYHQTVPIALMIGIAVAMTHKLKKPLVNL
jgi:O-antigen ligase